MSGLEPRLGALAVLRRVGAGAHLDRSIDLELARRSRLPRRDRSLLTALAYQTVRYHRRLDLAIERAAKRKMSRIDEDLRDILRLGAVQLLCFDSVPPHAAVDTTVTIAARTGHSRTRGFVNAVLRELARSGFAPPEGGDPVARLAEEQSYPEWLVRRWVDRFGFEAARAFAERMNRPAPLVLRPARGEDVTRLIADLRARGFEAAPSPFLPDAVRVQSAHPAELPGWSEARYQIQDEASQAVGLLLGRASAEERVLDACAGLGTKAIQLAERADPAALVLAHDPSRGRLRAMSRVSLPAGMRRPARVEGRADGTLPFPSGSFHRVLVDAPCTGLGSLRRHPEIKWRSGPSRIARHAELQRSILREALRVLAPGGTLVYATCTVTVEENEDVVRAALEAHDDVRVEGCADTLPEPLRPCVGSDGFFRSYPEPDGIDAFFAAVLRRR